MADFHYTPNGDGPTHELLSTLKSLDCELPRLRLK